MESEDHASVPVFFIVGRARSGTTLLRSILDNHSSVIIPPECPFVVNLYSRYHKRKNWTSCTLEKFYNDVIKQPAFDYLNINKDKLRNDILSSPLSILFDGLCRLVYLNYKPATPKENIKLIGDKNPHYSLFIPRLIKIFPEARFLHIIRDPRANVLSMMDVDFESPMLASLAWRWKYYNRTIERQKIKHPECFCTIRYEDLVKEPEKYTHGICSYLGIEFTKSMLDFHKNKEEILKTYPADAIGKYHKSLFLPISDARVDTWKQRLKPRQIKAIDAVTGYFASAYGYQMEYERTSVFQKLYVLPGIFYGWLYMVWGSFISILPFSIKMKVIYLMAVIFKPWWRKYRIG